VSALSNSIWPNEQAMFGPSNGQTPRSSTSNPSDSSSATVYSGRALRRVERGESSSSTWATGGTSLDGVSGADDGTHITSGGQAEVGEGVSSRQDGNSYRRHRPRNSGGFLLESTFTHIKQPDFTQQRANHERVDTNAKGKGVGDGVSTRTRKPAHPRHRPKASLGSSPLAIEVTNARVSGEDGAGQESAGFPDKMNLENVDNAPTKSLDVGGDTYRKSDSRLSGRYAQPAGALAPPLGLETDSVDIVNLALNLSESRRRTVSAGRLSTSNAVGNRRVVSMSMPSPGLPESSPAAGAGGSLRQHMQQQRRVSRNISPLPVKNQSSRFADASPVLDGSSQGQVGRQSTVLLPLALGLSQDVQYNFSDATLSRAAKARAAMELSYEYRRLLQYLPPIQSSMITAGRPTLPQSSPASASQTFQETLRLGRQYNPLQYVRNRRLRARLKLSLDAEAEGWGDLQRVRGWVDKVADQPGRAIPALDAFSEKIALPEFKKDVQELPHSEDPSSSYVTRHTGLKAPHQRLDWMIAPAELLADAFWLEEGTNKKLIEDKNGDKLLQSNLLSNTLKAPSIEYPVTTEIQLSEDRGSRSQKFVDLEALPSSMHQSPLDNERAERGRQHHQLHVSRHSLQERSASRYAETSRQKGLIRSRSSSGSPEYHGRHFIRRFSDSKKELSDRNSTRALIQEQKQLLWEEIKGMNGTGSRDIDVFKDEVHEGPLGRTSLGSRNTPLTRRDEQLRDKFHRMPDPITVLREHAASTPRASLDSNSGKRSGRSTDDLDMTAPNSPIAPNFVPSIAINLSPPPSRSTSPSKNSLKSKLNLLRPERSKERQPIDDIDLALGDVISRRSSRQVSAESDIPGTESSSKLGLPSPSKKRLPRNINDSIDTDARSPDSRFRRDGKELREPESRLRGIFKGRRIAQLVGTEVSRVGDFLWRRDLPTDTSVQSSPASSMASELSDSDVSDALSWGRETNQGSNLSRTSTKVEDGKRFTGKEAGPDQPKYHMSNLPIFKSPYREDEPKAATYSGAMEQDHITSQQAAQRERGRPARFDRFAPPRIDIRNASPSPHKKAKAISLGAEATEKANGHLKRITRPPSSERGLLSLNEPTDPFLDTPGSFGRRGPPVTGLTSLGVSNSNASAQRPSLDRQRQWSISDRKVSSSDQFPTKHETAHIRALLLSSGIKAKEICRRANEVRTPSPGFLENITDKPLPLVPRAQEHVLASRLLIHKIERVHKEIEDAKERFAGHTVTELHERIRLVDERIQNQLTPLVRACADEADAFCTELTTTQTLAVKQLNDSVHHIMRRRRRRLKWIRRAGYVLLEWTLLGIMWWAWLVVVIIRLARGGVGGIVGGVRWLLWL